MIFLLAAAQAALLPVQPVTAAPAPVIASAFGQVPSATITLLQDTPVELMAVAEVNTDDAKPGSVFRLRVNRPVEIDGRVVVPVGTPAFGQVLTATDAGGLGKSGRLTAKLLHVLVGDVEVPIEGQTAAKGTGAGSAGVAVLFTGLMGLFHRGNNAKIKAGEILSGYVARDVVLDLSGPVARAAASAGTAPLPPPPIVGSPAPVR